MPIAEANRAAQERALERVMALHGRALKRTCFMMLGDAGLAEDAAQESLFKFYQSLSRFRGEASEKTWLMRIAMNVCRDMLRTSWLRRVDRRVTLEDLPQPEGDEPTADHAVTEAVMALPVKYRETILLYYYQNMSTGEIAQALHQSVNTVKSRLGRGKQRLAERLEGWYFDE